MSYKTLYRTYRPKDFNDMVGQEHIIKTFKNALQHDKIAHAYLFTGPRGTGKTSVAKIIAKAVNCKLAPTAEPCNECESCKGINGGFDSDVFEIDAASNNGVDEIREIRDKVKYAPTVGRYKVYIIDEVHMLSTGAFNALLKTLEEPPQHVIFILATTEPHKIPATIISRCQRFDFKSISIKDIVSRIHHVVAQEHISIEEKAVWTIAKNAQGGMRDALSLLDQALSFSDGAVTEESVHEVTGTVSEEHMVEIVESLVNKDASKAIQQMDSLISQGKEPLRLVENLIYFFRDVFLIQKMNHIDEELIINHSIETITLSKRIPVEKLMSIISVLNNSQYEMRKTNYPRVFIELAIFELVDFFSPVAAPQVETIQTEMTKEAPISIAIPIPIEPKMDQLRKVFIDVSEIEEILNDANKEKKLSLTVQWSNLNGADIDLSHIEQLLNDGTIEAVSNQNRILLSFEFDSACAKLYDSNFYNKALDLLEKVFHERYTILAIPKKIWNIKREEYIAQFKNKIKQPKLTPITEPLLVKRNQDKYEFEPEMVKEVINLFGEEIVNIK